jgi:hypothetical protein
VKARAKRTNQINVAQGVTTLERRESHLHACAQALAKLEHSSESPNHSTLPGKTPYSATDPEKDDAVPADAHHHIAYKGTTVRFIDFFDAHKADPAVQVSLEASGLPDCLTRICV